MTAKLTERSHLLKVDMVNKRFGLSDATIDGNKASTPDLFVSRPFECRKCRILLPSDRKIFDIVRGEGYGFPEANLRLHYVSNLLKILRD